MGGALVELPLVSVTIMRTIDLQLATPDVYRHGRTEDRAVLESNLSVDAELLRRRELFEHLYTTSGIVVKRMRRVVFSGQGNFRGSQRPRVVRRLRRLIL